MSPQDILCISIVIPPQQHLWELIFSPVTYNKRENFRICTPVYFTQCMIQFSPFSPRSFPSGRLPWKSVSFLYSYSFKKKWLLGHIVYTINSSKLAVIHTNIISEKMPYRTRVSAAAAPTPVPEAEVKVLAIYFSHFYLFTWCPRRLDPYCIVTCSKKWVNTSWTDSYSCISHISLNLV